MTIPNLKSIKPKYLIIAGSILVVLLFIIFAPSSTPPFQTTPNLPNISPTSSNLTTPKPTYPVSIPSLTINWGTIKPQFSDGSYPTYTFTPLITDINVNKISQTLGFSNTDKNTRPTGEQIWKNTNNEILLYVPSKNTLDYQNTSATPNSKIYNEAQLIKTASDYVKKILPQSEFTIRNIAYYKNSGYYSAQSTKDDAVQAIVSLDQTLDNLPIIPSDLSSPNQISLNYTPELTLQSFTITQGFENLKKDESFLELSFSKLKSLSPDLFRRITPLRLNNEGQIQQAKTLTLNVTQIGLAYTLISNKIVPVYKIEGNLYANKLNLGKVIYLSPPN